jgi:SAM-dependent methyltransferase
VAQGRIHRRADDLDAGCGPGYATSDLAEIVGPPGRVWALERSRRFLDALEALHGPLPNVERVELDLDVAPFPEMQADGAWVRWVLCFVRRRARCSTRSRSA